MNASSLHKRPLRMLWTHVFNWRHLRLKAGLVLALVLLVLPPYVRDQVMVYGLAVAFTGFGFCLLLDINPFRKFRN